MTSDSYLISSYFFIALFYFFKFSSLFLISCHHINLLKISMLFFCSVPILLIPLALCSAPEKPNKYAVLDLANQAHYGR